MVKKFLWLVENAALTLVQFLLVLAVWWAKQKLQAMFNNTLKQELTTMSPVPAMTKAYDIQNLLQRFKARGLDLTEEAAKLILEESCGWMQESAVMSENKIDDVASLGIPQLKAVMLPLIDKIDGEQG